MSLKIKLQRLDPELPVPGYAHKTDAAWDLYSRIDITIKPGERALIPTGIKIAIPRGYAGFIQPRSGLAHKHGISIVNSPGLIDSGYRGEVSVILINQDPNKSFKIRRGDKICQLVIQKVERAEFEVVEQLDRTERGKAGFGSSGIT
jgi:dUTP pyrophosphatase